MATHAGYALATVCIILAFPNSPGAPGAVGTGEGTVETGVVAAGCCCPSEAAATAAEIICWIAAVCASLNSAAIFPTLRLSLRSRLPLGYFCFCRPGKNNSRSQPAKIF